MFHKSKLISCLLSSLVFFLAHGQELMLEQMQGDWKGTGLRFNQPATFRMNWSTALDEKFIKLQFQNEVQGFNQIFQAEALYRIESDTSATGWWFDSRKAHLEINVRLQKNRWTSHWGNQSEKGKTIYELISESEIQVRDFVWKNEQWVEFGSTSFRKVQTPDTNKHELNGITLAVTNMEAMVLFYQKLFGVDFRAVKKSGIEVFSGEWLSSPLFLCPAKTAGNTAEQNRHQFELLVDDLDDMIDKVVSLGGEIMHDPIVKGALRKVSIYDPDRNSMVLMEAISN